jgi:hypothetical protein
MKSKKLVFHNFEHLNVMKSYENSLNTFERGLKAIERRMKTFEDPERS